MHEAEQIERRRAGGRLDIAPGAAREMQDLEIVVGDDIGRRIALGDALGAALEPDIGAERSAPAAPRRRPVRRAAAIGNSGGSRVPVSSFLKIRARRSTGANSFGCRVTFSELPRNRKRSGSSAK